MHAVLSSTDSGPGSEETIRVLIAEDDAATRRLLRIRLRRAGFNVLCAASGEEAIEICDREEEPIHLLITDGIMPGIDGFELARHVARRDPPIRAILLSGFLDYFLSRADIPGNIEAFVAKPFVSDDLVAKVLDLVNLSV